MDGVRCETLASSSMNNISYWPASKKIYHIDQKMIPFVAENGKNGNIYEHTYKYIYLSLYIRQNSRTGPWTIARGSVLSLNFQNGRFSPQTLLSDSISSQNYEDDRFSHKFLYFGLNFIHKLPKCILVFKLLFFNSNLSIYKQNFIF
jgi:hypothetical protein